MSLVTLAVAKKYLQISHSEEDDIIQVLIDSAEEYVSDETGIYFHDGEGEITEDLDGGELELMPTKRPINSVTGILDTENDNEATTGWKHTKIRILSETDGTLWGRGIQRWRVTYDAGYDSNSVPVGIRHAILDLVYRGYTNRGGKGHQSAAGHGYDWQGLDVSDIAKRLRKYRMKASIG
jgi:hypothetical protein